MSNTGRNKKLASFNCDEELWSAFMQRCQEQRTTATATLTQFISLYKDGKLDNLDADMLGDANGCSRLRNMRSAHSDHRFDERVKASVDKYLEQRLPSHLDKYLATNQDKQLYSTVIAKSYEDWLPGSTSIHYKCPHLSEQNESVVLNK